MKILIIDGQGGHIGSALIAGLAAAGHRDGILAIGTNAVATAAMLKAGASAGATGENPVVVNARDADVIAGPVGILAADALLGEITPTMANAIAASAARKVLVPVNRCNIMVAGTQVLKTSELIADAVKLIMG